MNVACKSMGSMGSSKMPNTLKLLCEKYIYTYLTGKKTGHLCYFKYKIL